MGELEGKVALITGGASGIGLATAWRLGRAGCAVVVVDRDDEAGRALPGELAASFIAADVGSPADWERVATEVRSDFGGLDIAYLNAGVTTQQPDITRLTDEQYRRVMGANVDGVVFGVRAAVPLIEARGGGAVVVTASLAGLIGFSPDPVYTLTKHAVVGLVRSLAPQLGAKGITINAVCPGIVDTPLVGAEAKASLDAAGFPLMPPAQIADAVFHCVTGSGTGEAFVCQAGLDPTPFRFPRVPGPRAAGAEGRLPPPDMTAHDQAR